MPRLTAVYEFQLCNPVRTQVPDGEVLRFETRVDSFHVVLSVFSSERPRHVPNGQDPIRHASTFKVSVSRDEADLPPIELVDGGRNVSKRSDWFEPRIESYKEVACAVANRFVQYCKYSLHTPLLESISPNNKAFNNARWMNEQGDDLETGFVLVTLTTLSASGPSLLGQRSLQKQDEAKLIQALHADRTPSSAREFWSNSQTSTIEKKFPRAVLELAIACEVAIKRAFFEVATAAGAAFEYLEDKGKVSVRAIDLLHGPAEEAFSESFKKRHPDEFKLLDHLFRCRNKVAHRGEAKYRDDAGKLFSVDRPTLENWWAAVATLFEWIEAKAGRPA